MYITFSATTLFSGESSVGMGKAGLDEDLRGVTQLVIDPSSHRWGNWLEARSISKKSDACPLFY